MTFVCATKTSEWGIQIRRGEVYEMERVIYGDFPIHTSFKAHPNTGELRLTTPIKEAVFEFFTENTYDLVCNSLVKCLRGAEKELMEGAMKKQ